MHSMRSQLSSSYLLLLLAAVGVTGVLTWLAVEGLYIETERQNLLAQARLIATALRGSAIPVSPVQPYVQTSNVQPGIHIRLLDENGGVVIGLPLQNDSTFIQAPEAEHNTALPAFEIIQRPEIQSALRGQPVTAIRQVASAGNRRVIYAAAPVLDENGQVTGIVYIATPLPSTGLPANLLMELAAVLLAVVLLAAVAGRLLAGRIARPLEKLSSAADAIAGGNLEQNIPVEQKVTELHILGTAFNSMADSLRRSDRSRKAFIADVTHELRTPLTVIKGTIETLEDGALDDRQGRMPLLASMSRETDRLIRLVNELLILTRAEARSLHLDLLPLDLDKLARERCENISHLAATHKVDLQIADHMQDPLPVLGDADRLAQVLDNLLDNALRYAPPNTTITVTLCQAGQGLECTVRDEGPGIPAEHLPFIFERFYRVEPARDRQSGGTGLGLAIVRALVLAHGGQIRAESHPGQGTSITFWLPAAETATKLPDS